MDLKYEKLYLENIQNKIYNGKGLVIDGKNQYVHLVTINNCKNLIFKNFTFKNGNTNLLKNLPSRKIRNRNEKRSIFELIDGGAILIINNSSVKFVNCTFENNKALMCGGAISNQSLGKVSFYNCLFKNNIAGHTGAAIDNLTQNANLIVRNCKFINNISNVWNNYNAPHGQISIFPKTKALIINSYFCEKLIPFDYDSKSEVYQFNNIFNGKDIEIKKSKRSNLSSKIKSGYKLYWLLPKSLNKVYFSANKKPQKQLLSFK